MKKLLILTVLVIATPGFADDTDTGAPAEEQPAEIDEEKLDQLFNQCRQYLSLDLKAEYLDLPAIYKREWLNKNCKANKQPLPPKKSAIIRPKHEWGQHINEWPGERIVAHVLFWPGLVSLTSSISYLAVSAKAGVAGDTAGGWAPNLILGGVLIIGSLVASVKYSSKKRNPSLAFEPSICNLTVRW